MNQEDGSGNVRLNDRLGVADQVWQNLHNALERKASEAETLRLRVEWLEAGINAALSHYGSLPITRNPMSLLQGTIANTKDSTRADNFKPDESNGMHFPCSACIHCNGSGADSLCIPDECRACRYFFN